MVERIGNGATRECYLHPHDSTKCVKVLLKKSSATMSALKSEIKHYAHIKSILGDYVVEYDRQLVQTNKGPGLVCELLREPDGSFSPSLAQYLLKQTFDDDLQMQLNNFARTLIQNKLFFYDFNAKNFVIQVVDGRKKLKYVDLKSFNNSKTWKALRMEKLIPPLGNMKMVRRLKRLYKQLGLDWLLLRSKD